MAYKVTIKGLVQGVGFRPFVYRRAKQLGFWGYVKNTGSGVEILTNKKFDPRKFLAGKPPMARVDSFEIKNSKFKTQKSFKIKKSQKTTGYSEIPPDIFLCPDCLKDLRDPGSRRYQYPFISCTNCGPRFSVVRDTPYDRENTSMHKFKLCPKCEREYNDPDSRWYHAETIACPNCGPKVSLHYRGKKLDNDDPIAAAAEKIKKGEIVAIKGIGGFHLVCQTDTKTVQKLRRLTDRPRKPFALMLKNITQSKSICTINQLESETLCSAARPIVVLRKKQRPDFTEVSNLDSLGLMLPYTGLHYLLFDHFDEPLVFTSANLPDHPLTTKRSEQFVKYVLDHNREIVNAIDDSVIKVINGHALFLRRARGYVPTLIAKKVKTGGLALGAEQNSTFSISLPEGIITSQHLGNIREPEAYLRFKKTTSDYLNFYKCNPQQIVSDLHPRYQSSEYGRELKLPHRQVQHHQAHIRAVAAEHGLTEYIGIAADGVGLGSDGSIWGGEVFLTQIEKRRTQTTRIGSLELQPMIGGDKASEQPPRMLFGILAKFLEPADLNKFMQQFYSSRELTVLRKQLASGFNVTPTSSAGRVLDATTAILEFCQERTYEGEPAITLEANSTLPYQDLEPIIKTDGKIKRLQTTPLFEYIWENRHRDSRRLAATAQHYLAAGWWQIAKQADPDLPIVFAGGVAYNRIITIYLTRRGVLVNKEIPPGDGGVSFGQLF